MKILYAIQGTGNGHLSRARDIIPLLQKNGELDILVSGTEADVTLPYPVKYALKGLSFVFGKKGGVDILKTYKKGKVKRLYKEIHELPVEEYDIIINDFEPVSAWACKLKSIPCIGLSHQAAVNNIAAPKPKKKDLLGMVLLKKYAPVSVSYGFHFKAYAENIFTPVIRSQVRHAVPEDKGHYCVYLPAYADELIIALLSEIDHISWQVFSKEATQAYTEKNITISKIENDAFIQSLVTCTGVICGAGFETPAEAMFLKKQLLVIPMTGQYEQQCNAAALELMGVKVLKNIKLKQVEKIKSWITFSKPVEVNYADQTSSIIDELFEKEWHASAKANAKFPLTKNAEKKFRKRNVDKIIYEITR